MMGSSSSWGPAGLRVLVVDNDVECLKILQKLLNKCNYQVRTCNLSQDALHFLEENEIDIVIGEVNMSDMDGLKFLEHVHLLKMDLPIIMMSADGEASRVMKAIQHGACDYLVKPIRIKELRNIWQHVYRKRMHELKGIEDEIPNGSSELSDGGMILDKKRKEIDGECGADSCSSGKKPRVVWNAELHDKFVKAVGRIGLDKVGPKKILDLMGVPWLTRENVASHLQKFRMYQKKNELKAATSSGLHLSPSGNVCVHSRSVSMQQNIVINENTTTTTTTLPGDNIQIHGAMPYNQFFHLLNSEPRMQAWPPSHVLNSRSYPEKALSVVPQCHPLHWNANMEENNGCVNVIAVNPHQQHFVNMQQQQHVNLESYGYNNHQEGIAADHLLYDLENFSSEDLGVSNQGLYYASPEAFH